MSDKCNFVRVNRYNMTCILHETPKLRFCHLGSNLMKPNDNYHAPLSDILKHRSRCETSGELTRETACA